MAPGVPVFFSHFSMKNTSVDDEKLSGKRRGNVLSSFNVASSTEVFFIKKWKKNQEMLRGFMYWSLRSVIIWKKTQLNCSLICQRSIAAHHLYRCSSSSTYPHWTVVHLVQWSASHVCLVTKKCIEQVGEKTHTNPAQVLSTVDCSWQWTENTRSSFEHGIGELDSFAPFLSVWARSERTT